MDVIYFLVTLSILCALVFVVKKTLERKHAARCIQHVENIVSQAVSEHKNTLLRKRRTLVRIGDYGEKIDDQWKKEIAHFVDVTIPNVVYDFLEGAYTYGAVERHDSRSLLIKQVEQEIDKYASEESRPNDTQDISNLTGVEYERLCQELLEQAGWAVHRTPESGDNGVDLLARRGVRHIAVQCKKYDGSVGNSAVQEAYSGMTFFEAGEAAVITTGTVTKSARTLANKLSVKLIHHEQIKDL